MSHVGVQPGMSVLEVECSTGRITVPLARAVSPGGRVVAIDTQNRMLDKIHKRLMKHNMVNVELRQGTLGVGESPFQGIFDRVVLVAVLGEIPDKLAALRELLTALKPSGILSVTELK